MQDQFTTKKPPKTYRYDSSLDPEMSWDENGAAHRWCNAVNNDGRFGRWSYHLVKQPPDLAKLLDSLQGPA